MTPRAPQDGQASTTADSENPGGFVHIPALDGIRGMAILMVLLDHLFWANDNTSSAFFNVVTAVFGAMYVGVNLFFVLSGFLITGILLDTLEVPHFFKNFYARRSLRIFPLYYGSLFLLLLLTRPMHFVWSGWQYYFLTYTSNLADWRSNAPLYLGFFNINHFWSLQVEEQFYLVWPLIVYRLRSIGSIIRVSLIGCALILGIRIFLTAMRGHPGFTDEYLPYSPTFSCADNILYGCCLCALLRSSWRGTILRLAPYVLASVAAIMLFTGIANHGLNWAHGASPKALVFIPTLGFSLVGIACASVIALTLKPRSPAQRLFATPLLRFFGRYSYGIYVFHYSISGLIANPMRTYLTLHFHNKALSVFVEAVTAGALTIVVALLSYHLYEVQFLRMKRFFSYNSPARLADPRRTV